MPKIKWSARLRTSFTSVLYLIVSTAALEAMDSGAPRIPLLDVVLVGGGHAHVHVIKMLGMNPIANVRFTLITKDILTPYSGMLPGYVAGYYTAEECHIDLGKLCSFARFRLVHAEVTKIDTEGKLIHCNDGRPPLSYNILSINIGIVPRPLDAKDFAGNGLGEDSKRIEPITAVKPIDKFALRWEHILARLLEHAFAKSFTIAIVGGGAGGVELCFAVFHRLKTHLQGKGADCTLLKVLLLNRSGAIMSSHSRYSYISVS
jgi:selenide,water dikinase